jgi:Periplasmic binding protein
VVNHSGGINGQPISFAIFDDQSSPGTAVQLLNTVLAKRPMVVLGSSFVSTCGAMAPLVEKAGVSPDQVRDPSVKRAVDTFIDGIQAVRHTASSSIRRPRTIHA